MSDHKIIYDVTIRCKKTFQIPVSVGKDQLIEMLANGELDKEYLDEEEFEKTSEINREYLFGELMMELFQMEKDRTITEFIEECEDFDMEVNHATPLRVPEFDSLFPVNKS